MTMVKDMLQQIPGLGLPQRQFRATLCVTSLVRRGRVHFRHLRRSGDSAARTSARQGREPCAWPALQPRVLLTALDAHAALGSAPDASGLPTRGQPTGGLGPCGHGGASRAARGRAMAPLAVVEGTRRGALTRAGAPPPPAEEPTPPAPAAPRVDGDPPPRRAPRQRVPSAGTSPCVDGSEAKQTSREAVVRLALHALTRLRSAAACRVLSTGPHPQRRGARRPDAGTGNGQAWSRCEARGPLEADAPRPWSPAVGWPQTLQRRGRLVGRRHRHAPAPPRVLVLGAPEPARQGRPRGALYAARLQSACLCRASQQCPGLLDGQARAAAAVAWQGTAALAPRHLGRAEAWRRPQDQEPHVVSRARWQQGQGHERVLDGWMEQCALDPTWVQNHACDDELRTDGAIAA
jgi:hypothetical protein